MFQTLKNVLFDRLRQQGVSEAVEAAQVTEVFKDEVAKRFGPSTRDAYRKLVLRGDTLEVLLTSQALASELRMAEFELEDALKAHFNGKHYRLRIFG
jgi:predicted nucleic acid-binding Zn ribbon protein